LTDFSFATLFTGIALIILGLFIGTLRRRAEIPVVLLALGACVALAISTVNTVLHGRVESQTIAIPVLIGVITFLVGVIIALRERRRPNYTPGRSVGLLYAGVGIFAVICAIMLPVLPTQFTWQAPTLALPTMAVTPTPAAIRTLITPTSDATITRTPTAIPSLTPTPTITVIPTRTIPTATPTLPVACEATTRENVNLRSGAGTTFERLATIPQGSRIEVEARTETDSGEWLRIRYNDQQGWISAEFARLDEGCNVPTIED
jgi:hypothetical protein